LTQLVAQEHPPEGEVNDILRRLAASLLADMPKGGVAGGFARSAARQ